MNEHDSYNGLPASDLIRLANLGLREQLRRNARREIRLRIAVEDLNREKEIAQRAIGALGDPFEQDRRAAFERSQRTR